MAKKILIIDDEEDFCYFVKQNLEEEGKYEVKTVTDGKKGIQTARSFRPHLILLDIMMPGIDGLEVLKSLKKDTKTCLIPVLMLSARTDIETKQQASSLYDQDYIEKPVEKEVLRQKIEKTLAQFGNA